MNIKEPSVRLRIEGLLSIFCCEGNDMKKAASIYLRTEICRRDVDRMICWMESPNVIKYLNEDPNIVPWLKRLNASTPEPMLNYHFNRMGRFFMVCRRDEDGVGFVRLMPADGTPMKLCISSAKNPCGARGWGKAPCVVPRLRRFWKCGRNGWWRRSCLGTGVPSAAFAPAVLNLPRAAGSFSGSK